MIAHKYEIVKKLGVGGFGEVFLTRHIELGSLYAVKLLREEISQDENFAERFKREANILARLVHKNSVTLRDFGRADNGCLYMAMDYCPGQTLEDRLKQSGPLAPQKTLEAILQILSVMQEAHTMGIIHRDLKPDNIMIEEDGAIKVLDFGIAKLKAVLGVKLTTLTQQGSVVGTPLYMSPEQAGGAIELEATSDIYSLGLVMYKMLTGKDPFFSDRVDRILRLQMTTLPPSFEEVCPELHLPKALEKLVFWAIQKEKEDRIQSAEAFQKEIQKIKEDSLSPSNTTVSPSSRIVTQITPHDSPRFPTSWKIALALCLTILVLVFLLMEQRKKERSISRGTGSGRPGASTSPMSLSLPPKNKEKSLYKQAQKLEKKGKLKEAFFLYYQAGATKQKAPFYRNFKALRRKITRSFGGYTEIASLTKARGFHTATLLPSGKVWLAGGFNARGTVKATEFYDPKSKTFTPGPRLTTSRGYHTATLLSNGRVLLVGGSNGRRNFNIAEIWDPQRGSLVGTALSRAYRVEHTATLLPNGKVLVAGGRSMMAYTAQKKFYVTHSAEIYDPRKNAFKKTGFLQSPRANHTATLLNNGQVLVSGGYVVFLSPDLTRQTLFSLPFAELYNPKAGKFSKMLIMRRSRYGHSSTLLPDGEVLIAGGFRISEPLASAELYDPAREKFIFTGAMKNPRGLHSAVLLPQGLVLITGGQNPSGHVAEGELYDPQDGQFYFAGKLATPRSGKAVLLPTGEVLFPGGVVLNHLRSCAEVYNLGLDFAKSLRPTMTNIGGRSPFFQSLFFGQKVQISGQNFQSPPKDGPDSLWKQSHYVCLLGLGSSGFNYQESSLSRYFRLKVTKWGPDSIEVTLPPHKNNPSAYYMMFVVVHGLLSEGKIIKVE